MHQINTFRLAHLGADDLLVHQATNLLFVSAVVHRFHGIASRRLAQLGEKAQVRLVALDQFFGKALVLEKAARAQCSLQAHAKAGQRLIKVVAQLLSFVVLLALRIEDELRGQHLPVLLAIQPVLDVLEERP
ncbi:hypothetical protein D3C86_1411330 [compost metagenome]